MTIATFISRRRRVLVLCVATLLLHYAALGWLGPQLGHLVPPAPDAEAGAIVAELHVAQSVPTPAPAAPLAVPAPKRAPPRAKAAKTAAQHASPPQPVAEPAAGEVGMAATAPAESPAEEGAAVQRGAAGVEADVKSAQPAAAAAAAAAAEVPPAAAEPVPAAAPRRYRASLPPPAELSLDVSRTDADGKVWSGEAAMAWKASGGSYTMTVEAGIRVIFTRVNLVVLSSEGRIGEEGFAPVTMTEKRRGRALTATHFNQQDGRITFSASQNSSPLLPGTQDKATVPLQLAAIARADSSQLDGGVEIMVGEDKDASVFRFVVLGQEEIETRLGKMQTWHLSRPPRPGAYGSRLDVWLAPAHEWYPVQIRNSEANGAVTTQTISKIVVTDTTR